MAILESQLNGRIATLLGRMASRWDVSGENRGAFQGSQRQPDILIVQPGAQPVVIENEYLPARTVEAEARDRLGESLDASVVNASGRINAAVALRSPTELHDCAGLDDVDAMLTQGVTLEYALYAGPGGVDYSRFPKSGFIPGSIRDLAAFVEYAATPEDAVQRAVMILEDGVQDAAAILRQAEELSGDTQTAIPEHLRGCVRSLGHVLEWRYETQTIPQRPDRRTVGCSGFPTPISQDRWKATYCRPTGGRQRHCVRSAQRLHVASHAA